jgi:hypothetical protein
LEKKRLRLASRYYSGIWLEVNRKSMENLLRRAGVPAVTKTDNFRVEV